MKVKSTAKLLFVSILTAFAINVAHANTNWTHFDTSDDDIKEFYYDANDIRTTSEGDYELEVLVEYNEAEIDNAGNAFDTAIETWVYDCQGMMRVDDELWFLGDDFVDSNLGTGDWEVIQSNSVGETLEKIICQ